jgi:hypothetical protein
LDGLVDPGVVSRCRLYTEVGLATATLAGVGMGALIAAS